MEDKTPTTEVSRLFAEIWNEYDDPDRLLRKEVEKRRTNYGEDFR